MTNHQTQLSFTVRVLVVIAALGLVLAFMNYSADFINALILSWLIVLVASPLLRWLRSKRVPMGLSFALTLIAILAIFVTFDLLLVVAVNRLVETIPTYASAYEDLVASIQATLASLDIDTTDIQASIDFLDPTKLIESVAAFLSDIIGTVSGVILVALLVVYLLLDAIIAPAKLAKEIKAGNKYLQRFFTTSIPCANMST